MDWLVPQWFAAQWLGHLTGVQKVADSNKVLNTEQLIIKNNGAAEILPQNKSHLWRLLPVSFFFSRYRLPWRLRRPCQGLVTMRR